jgi:hypothetical protein
VNAKLSSFKSDRNDAQGLRHAGLARTKVKSRNNAAKRGFRRITGEASFVQETSFESKNRATVNIESLKLFVSQNFPRDHPLRKLLAAERSTMSVPDYLAKLESWLCLLREIK